MATFDRKIAYSNPSAIADKGGELPGGGSRVTAKRARKSCSDECYMNDKGDDAHWYGTPDGERQ